MRTARRIICLLALLGLAAPSGAAGKAGDIVVGDFDGLITRLGPSGTPTSVIGTGAPLAAAYGVDFGPDGRVYVANSAGAPDSGLLRLLPGSTTAQAVDSGAPFDNPLDVEFGPDGTAYVAEDQDGVIAVPMPAGPATEYAFDAAFVTAYALVIAPDGVVYVADPTEILQIDPATKAVTSAVTIPDSPLPGSPSLTGLERAPSGLLYAFDDGEGRLIEVDLATDTVRTASSGGFLGNNAVYNIAMEPAGTLVMGNYDIDRIVRVNPATGAQSLIPGTFTNIEGIAVEPPRCAGRTATVVGSTTRDVITASRFPDVIATLGGNDVVRGLAGNDIACGGPGRDRLIGGAGGDRLLGQGGADVLRGGAARDRLIGGKGADRLAGGGGRDVLRGGAGIDRQRQ